MEPAASKRADSRRGSVMQHVVLVTDSSADLPDALQRESGVLVAPGSFAFDEEALMDGSITPEAFYGRMRRGAVVRPFGVSESTFDQVFHRAMDAAESVLCLVTPFDVSASFTTAAAAVLAMDDPPIKVLNPGVASAGLCSLITALAPYARAGQPLDVLLAAIDLLEPYCDTLFVPSSVEWLRQAGRLPLIEDRIGEIGSGMPVVRVGTRMTGVSREESRDAALERVIAIAGARAGDGTQLIVTVTHADCVDEATHVADLLQRRWNVVRTIITDLSPTIGSQVGPGAIGVGVSPARPVRGD